jgi:hypothetical protein
MPVAPASAGLDHKAQLGIREGQSLRDKSLVNSFKSESFKTHNLGNADNPHISRSIPEGYKLRSRVTKSGTIRESLVAIASIQRRRMNKKRRQQPEPVDKSQLAHPEQSMLFNTDPIDKIRLQMLGDTGASANVTSRTIAVQTKHKIYNLDRPIPIEYANGTKGEVFEYCNMKLRISGYKFTLPCYITEDVGDVVILGVPFFMIHQVSIDWRKQRWLIRPYNNLETRIVWKAINYEQQWKSRRYETKSIFIKMIKQQEVMETLAADPIAEVFKIKIDKKDSATINDHRPEKSEFMEIKRSHKIARMVLLETKKISNSYIRWYKI